ncbi:MAG: hypothetical protein KDA96_24120, partial [Planctomycetaceae bacterium]|nr:hypothetical protein [Planctomycetaceae bacterium]
MRISVVAGLLATIVGGTGLVAMTMQQDRAEMRKQAAQRLQENNHAEALVLYRQLLEDEANSDRDVALDLRNAVDCLRRLNLVQDADDLIESAVELHSDQWRLLYHAAAIYSGSLPDHGYLIAGKFQRGNHRGGGQVVSAAARDRVRALQLLLKAIPLLAADANAVPMERVDVFRLLARLAGESRHQGAWRLQELTDLTTLPDYASSSRRAPFLSRRFEGGGRNTEAPVDANGDPVFHRLPPAWDQAASDGERWRWALRQIAAVSKDFESEADLEWAQFLQSQFGVRNERSLIVRSPESSSKLNEQQRRDDEVSLNDSLMLLRLPDNETVANLADGTRRVSLPDEFNHLVVLKRIIARNDNQRRSAIDQLIRERMNRRQYDQAAELLEDARSHSRDRDDRKRLQDQIDQIRKNWVRFEAVQRAMDAGNPVSLDVRFRNGGTVQFDARPVRTKVLLDEARAYLQSRPATLDREQLQISNIGYRLIQENGSRYLDPVTAQWSVDVAPPEHHFDGMTTIDLPFRKPGAYWVTARMQDGNQCHIVLWIADTTISRKRVEDGTLYYVADATTGQPIASASLEFFGWNQERIGRTREYRLTTARFADRTDHDGLCIPDPGSLRSNMQWLTIATTPDGRMAYDGFE